jgi:nicotinamidase-related amidase
MSLTLDDVAALIVIDLQKGILAIPTAYPAGVIVERCSRLANAFRESGLPVVLVNVDGRAPGRTDSTLPSGPRPADWADLVPELDPRPGDVLVTKRRFGAFLGTTLHAELQRRGATQVVMTGISTSIGVESTARSAYDLGYNVAFAVDAMTDRSAENHRHSVENVFPRIGETGTTADVLALLASRVKR